MKRLERGALMILAGALLAGGPLDAARSSGQWPELSFPSSVELREVAPAMVSNGVPMRVYGFRSHQRIVRVLEDTRRHLRERGFVVGEVLDLGEMKTLGVSDDAHLVNIQGQRSEHGHGSAGFVVITPIMDLLDVQGTTPSVPLPDDVGVVSHDVFQDGSRRGESVLAVSSRLASDAGAAVVSGFRDDGWRPARNEITVDPEDAAVYRILTRGDRTCRIIAIDQVIAGHPMAVVSVNCHD